MKEKIPPTTEQCRKQLEEIAKEMNLPIKDIRVYRQWGKRGGFFNDETFVKLIASLYCPSSKFKIEWNEELGVHVAVRNS